MGWEDQLPEVFAAPDTEPTQDTQLLAPGWVAKLKSPIPEMTVTGMVGADHVACAWIDEHGYSHGGIFAVKMLCGIRMPCPQGAD